MAKVDGTEVRFGISENWRQFWLLVLVNAFVGGMIGMERTLVPEIATQSFHLTAASAVLSFIVVFGIVKAFTNYFSGYLMERYSRKQLLVTGWLIGLPLPFLIMWAPSWNWILAANVLLGIHQGFAWSATVVMKIDLAGEKQRGLAMGLNEFAGYLSVALVAYFTSLLAYNYGLRPVPFYLGAAIAVCGLFLSIFFVKDTALYVRSEAHQSVVPRLPRLFSDTTWRVPNLGAVTQAGFVNNLNDGMIWGLLPVYLAAKGFDLVAIGGIAAIYPGAWGIGQLFSGRLADIFCKKKLLFFGMSGQALALFLLMFAKTGWHFAGANLLLGLGTAMVYPTFLATIAENTHPRDRARSMGVFRFWRDLGYSAGALLTGFLTDSVGALYAIVGIATVTLISALILRVRMTCAQHPSGL